MKFYVAMLNLFLMLLAAPAFAKKDAVGAVYTMTNAAGGNEVLVFARGSNGALSSAGTFATGGLGTGGGLGNQGGLVLSEDNRWLLAVNAGSNEISVLEVTRQGLMVKDKSTSGGVLPISIAIHDNLVYVLNAGGNAGATDNITGFSLSNSGELTALAGSTRPLSAASTSPAQVEFSADGLLLVVTEKTTQRISTYQVGPDGLATGPTVNSSVGVTPFGFAFGKRGQLFVSEAFGGAPGASALSSYATAAGGILNVISASIPTTETAACWTETTGDGRFAYVTNTGSNTISGYAIDFDGSISLLDADGVTAVTGAGPVDLALSNNSRFAYTLNSGSGTISAFRVHGDGSLTAIPGASGLPAGANGLAAR